MKKNYILDTHVIIDACIDQAAERKQSLFGFLQPARKTIMDICLEGHDIFITEATIEELNQYIKRKQKKKKRENISQFIYELDAIKIQRENYPPTKKQILKQEFLYEAGLDKAHEERRLGYDERAEKFIDKFQNKKNFKLMRKNKKIIKEDHYFYLRMLDDLRFQIKNEKEKQISDELMKRASKIKFPKLIPDIEVLMETEKNNSTLVAIFGDFKYLQYANDGRPPILEVLPSRVKKDD